MQGVRGWILIERIILRKGCNDEWTRKKNETKIRCESEEAVSRVTTRYSQIEETSLLLFFLTKDFLIINSVTLKFPPPKPSLLPVVLRQYKKIKK
jgi:hypothetical protein